MEHIIGIKVKDKELGEVGFLTWGRVFHSVDSQTLLNIVKKHMHVFGIHAVETIELCETLQEVSTLPYFYEGLFEFSQRVIPDGKKYALWQDSMAKAITKGEYIYFLGLSQQQKNKASNLSGTISHGFAWND